MHTVPGFQKAQARLRMEGCYYRLREVARSPFVYDHEPEPPSDSKLPAAAAFRTTKPASG